MWQAVFGSRLDDAARGGDLNLMLELNSPVENPALLTARPFACTSRVRQGQEMILDAKLGVRLKLLVSPCGKELEYPAPQAKTKAMQIERNQQEEI